MGKTVSIDGLADAVMEELTEYNKLAGETMKKAVTKAGQTVRKEIRAGAPVRTGKYAKSWTTKRTKESSTRLEVTVYSPAGPGLSRISRLLKSWVRSSWKRIS